MRDAVANITLPTVRHPLEVVRDQFETWRKRRPCRGRIPEALKSSVINSKLGVRGDLVEAESQRPYGKQQQIYAGNTLFARYPKRCGSITTT